MYRIHISSYIYIAAKVYTFLIKSGEKLAKIEASHISEYRGDSKYPPGGETTIGNRLFIPGAYQEPRWLSNCPSHCKTSPPARAALVDHDSHSQRLYCKVETTFKDKSYKITRILVTHKENHGKICAVTNVYCPLHCKTSPQARAALEDHVNHSQRSLL